MPKCFKTLNDDNKRWCRYKLNVDEIAHEYLYGVKAK